MLTLALVFSSTAAHALTKYRVHGQCGSLQGGPIQFSFQAYTPQEIFDQCLVFFADRNVSQVYHPVIMGKQHTGVYSVHGVCTLISKSALAAPSLLKAKGYTQSLMHSGQIAGKVEFDYQAPTRAEIKERCVWQHIDAGVDRVRAIYANGRSVVGVLESIDKACSRIAQWAIEL